MSLRSFFRKIAGRGGNASRSSRGAKSHVNTKRNKRAASKAVRTCDWDQSDPFAYQEMMSVYTDEPIESADDHITRRFHDGKI